MLLIFRTATSEPVATTLALLQRPARPALQWRVHRVISFREDLSGMADLEVAPNGSRRRVIGPPTVLVEIRAILVFETALNPRMYLGSHIRDRLIISGVIRSV